ncbi:MAG TPA: phospholipase D-like domain-containing protein [Candidatus Acidoferrales bacterium]|nr:phospholipase D-like domain-containing protein [Candidatus Acidoferrales bacterium]
MKLIIEPEEGVAPILSAIKSAKKSVELAVFRFDHKEIEAALKATVGKGVRVTALIAHANRGGEKNLRKLELRFLDSGIIVARSSDDLVRYHDKFILIDRRILYVLSFNFTHMDIDHSRAFGIITHNVKWVHEAVRLFRADCTRTAFVPSVETFVVSPANSRKSLGAFLRRAKKQLLIYDPKITDKEMLRIMQERAKAGVEVRVIGKVPGRARLNAAKLAGCRLHTRTIIRDRHQAFVGSQSLREAELDSRRELGLIIRDPSIVKKLTETFEADWAAGAKKEEHPQEQKEIHVEVSVPIDEKREEKREEAEAEKAKAEAEKAVETLEKELHPLATTVKKAVRKAVAKAGEEVLRDKEVKDTVKKVVKKAVKEAVQEAVEASDNG